MFSIYKNGSCFLNAQVAFFVNNLFLKHTIIVVETKGEFKKKKES
ncbi:46535_t:CDS:2 [Gigaspora margarita]|uniref:46535_t:CDS:1 n=1 Tax=Gigaspora margarita TaxID=4874 RepID=A0ABM8W186_GIGMA|nr:46535_t:CDS:2 [Gigaspora margarita]